MLNDIIRIFFDIMYTLNKLIEKNHHQHLVTRSQAEIFKKKFFMFLEILEPETSTFETQI